MLHACVYIAEVQSSLSWTRTAASASARSVQEDVDGGWHTARCGKMMFVFLIGRGGDITVEEFVQGTMKLKGHAKSIDIFVPRIA